MRDVVYREVLCRSALNRVQGMPFDWSLNPFDGCDRGCQYCYAIAYRVKKDRAAASFHREVDVRINFADVLDRELREHAYSGGVALGTATDPWQAIEGKYRVTRRTLEAMARSSLPLSIITKSTMAVRDIDVLTKIARRGEDMLTVCVSVPIMDRELWRRIEPGTPPPLKRLEMLARLRGAGIDAGVLCAPILPGLTDSERAIDAVASAAEAHGATFFGWRPLKLDPGTKEFFFGFVAQEFPVLMNSLRALYPMGPHARREYQAALDLKVRWVKARHSFGERHRPRAPARPPQQLLLIA